MEFGRLQARDMLQHLWTGPISNASVDVAQGSRSVEVRAVGVTKVNRFFLCVKLLNLFQNEFHLQWISVLFFYSSSFSPCYLPLYRELQLIVYWGRLFIVKLLLLLSILSYV